jgi:hypothetical protein
VRIYVKRPIRGAQARSVKRASNEEKRKKTRKSEKGLEDRKSRELERSRKCQISKFVTQPVFG